jgi:hypothetical protein
MAQPLYVAPPINQISRQDLNDETCVICFEQLYLPGNNGPPIEITTCHHRFHRVCLQTYCGNSPNNTLTQCRCPTCQQRFNSNNQLEDLTQQVADRFAVLDAEDAAIAAGPIAGLNPQLKNYLQSNYNIDRITQDFTNCFSQIIDDAVAFANDNNIGFDKLNYGIQENASIPQHFRPQLFGDEQKIFQQKMSVLLGNIAQVNQVVLKYKISMAYSNELRNSLVNLNTINQNIQDAAFVNSLYQPANYPLNEEAGILFSGLSQGLGSKVQVSIKKLLASSINRAYNSSLYPHANPLVSQFLFDLLDPFIYTFVRHNDTRDTQHFYYLHLLPLTTTRINNTAIVRPDFRFFIRYFDCFVNFVTQLVAINFDVSQQLGGNRKKTKRKRGSKRIRKSRRYRK